MDSANKGNWLNRIRQRGAAVAEMVVVLPALLLVGLGAIQWALVYEAKSTLNHASMMAARAGAVDHASPTSIKVALARGLVPLYSPDKGATLLDTRAYLRAGADVAGPFTRVKIINPTQEAFEDFGTDETGEGELEIPNLRLHLKSTAAGSASGINVQDANLLKIEVLHGHKLKVPFVGPILAQAAALTTSDPQRLAMLADNRLPMLVTATVRMQSAARESNLLASVEEVDRDLADALADDGEGGDSGDGDGNTGGGGDGDSGDPNDPNDPGNNLNPTDDIPPEAFECEKPTVEQDNAGPPEEDKGFWGDLWDGIKDGLTFGYEFVKGFWAGLKQQVGDLADLVLHPIETAKGLIELGKSFFNDFEGTVKMIGEALGEDLAQLINCGAFDKGKVIGQYANPVFMLKLAAKLAKFGSLAKAIRATERALFKCASFGAGTSVVTADGRLSIEQIMEGQIIQSRAEQDYMDQPQRVTDTFGRTASHYHFLETEFDALEVTAEHPLWVQGKGWTPVKEIERGHALATTYGDVLVLNNIRIDEPLQVYNFSVDATPSYFVGSGIWAHNARKYCNGSLDRKKGQLRKSLENSGVVLTPGYQAHHLIPVAVAKEFTVLKHAADDLLYSIDRPRNGILLPSADDVRILGDELLPIHNTNHRFYDAIVREKLQALEDAFVRGDLTDEQIVTRIKQIEDELRTGLGNGSITLRPPDG